MRYICNAFSVLFINQYQQLQHKEPAHLLVSLTFNPLRPNNDVSQTSHCNIKGLSVSEVMRIENIITQVQFY